MEKCPVSGTDELVLAYGPLVRAVAGRYAHNCQEREDFIQEGFCALLRLIPKCPDSSILPAWLRLRLPPVIRDLANSTHASCVAFSLDEEEDEPPLPDIQGNDERERTELQYTLERCLEGLDLEIALCLWNGLSGVETAENLGVSRKCVTKRLERIRAVLRRAFESELQMSHSLQ